MVWVLFNLGAEALRKKKKKKKGLPTQGLLETPNGVDSEVVYLLHCC